MSRVTGSSSRSGGRPPRGALGTAGSADGSASALPLSRRRKDQKPLASFAAYHGSHGREFHTEPGGAEHLGSGRPATGYLAAVRWRIALRVGLMMLAGGGATARA